MRYDIKYGDGVLPIEISNAYALEHTRSKIAIEPPDIETMIYRELDSSGILSDVMNLSSETSEIAIVLDHPIQCPHSNKILDFILNSLESTSIPLSNVSLIISIPYYRRSNLNSLMTFLGFPGNRGCAIHVHEENRESSLRYLGDSHHSAIPVHLNSKYTDASSRILLSSTRPSIFTGATGGVISIASGISGEKTLRKLRKIIALNEPNLLDSTGVAAKAMGEVASLCPPDLSIISTQDSSGNLAGLSCGELQTSWDSAISEARGIAKARIQRRADIAIVGAGGRGFDGTLYDAIEGLYAGVSVTRTGGAILFIAECSFGPGPDGFTGSIATCENVQDLIIAAETNFENGMERARFFIKTLESRNLIICSRMRESLVTEKLKCKGVHDPQEGLEIAIRESGSNAKVALIQNGSNINPVMD